MRHRPVPPLHPVPRLHRLLVCMGLSAAGAACLISSHRNFRAASMNFAMDEVLRAAFQNRRSLRQPLPGSAKYR